jgi:transcriptional regulator with XRE-family HTH domain
MKFKDKYNVSEEFADIFSFRNEEEELEHEAYMIMFRFLSELEKLSSGDRPLRKNELAKKLGVSPSYITQLYNGSKLINLNTLAKIETAFDITFKIKASQNESLYSAGDITFESFPEKQYEPEGFWIWYKIKNPDYKKIQGSCEPDSVGESDSKYNVA